jgi:hypothetical protein
MTFELPKETTQTLYVAYQHSRHPDGMLCLFTFNPEEHSGDDWIVIAKEEVTVKIPQVDLIPKMVARLKESIDKEKADHEVKLNCFQDKINSLLALEYNPTNEDLPF